MSGRPGVRKGFTLAEMVTSLAIVAILTATVLFFYGDYTERASIAAEVSALRTYGKALRAFRQDVGAYPEDAAMLVRPLVSGDKDVCGRTLSSIQRSSWRGPYVNEDLANDLMIFDVDTLETTVKRSPATATSRDSDGDLRLLINGTPQARAFTIDSALDGDASLLSGKVTWKAFVGQGTTPRLTYDIPIAGC